MKKNLLVFSVLLLFGIKSYSQENYSKERSAYADAAYIKSVMDANGGKFTIAGNGELLKYYVGNVHDVDLVPLIKANPFLNPYFAPPGTQSVRSGLAPAGLASQVGNLGVTNIANGLAQFMIKRAGQELTVIFFQKFQKFVSNHPEIKDLFPKTCENLVSFSSYNYQKWLPTLRDGFYSDLKNIPVHIDAFVNRKDIATLLSKLPEISVLLKTVGLVDSVYKYKLPLTTAINVFAHFKEIDTVNYKKAGFSNFANGVKLFAIFSNSLRTSGADTTSGMWVGSAQLKTLIANDSTLNIFIGLVYSRIQAQKISFYTTSDKNKIDTIDFATTLGTLKTNVIKIRSVLTNAIAIFNEVDKSAATLKSKKAPTTDDYVNAIDSGLDVINKGISIAQQFNAKIDLSFETTLAKKATDTYESFYKQQYSEAILDLVYIADALANKQGFLSDSAASSVRVIGKDISKYGLLIANLIDAKTSADAEAAIESAVLPAGSFAVKQGSYFNISVNGYIGYAWAFNQFFNSQYSHGIYAPIGVSFSGDIKPFKNFNLPITVFFSVIDIGSVVSYQLTNGQVTGSNTSGSPTTVNTTSVNQQIKLGSLFSPSAQFFLEIKGAPLAFGIGYRRTPTLSYSSGTSYATVGAKNVFNATILIDIPFFTLYNNPRSLK